MALEILSSNKAHTIWLTPIPIVIEGSQSLPYPAECLPAIIRDAVVTYHQYGQQPLPLIACSALGNISLACQTMANVARDRLLISPVSLYFLIIAASGERKSAADYTFSQAIRHWEQKTRETLAPEIRDAQTCHQAWAAEKEGLLNKIRRAAFTGEDAAWLRQKFIAIMKEEPTIPLSPTLFFEDVTQEALASQIAHGWPSSSLWSDEGAIFLSSHSMQTNTTKFVGLLNRLWDGKDFITHRKTSKNFIVANRRLTVSLMMQPLILQQMLAKNGGINRQSGFMARSLMTCPTSAMGERHYQEPPESLTTLRLFHHRLTECLNESLFLDKNGCHEIPTLSFSNPAKTIWVSFFNEIESGLAKSWATIKDFASKSAENTARLSALLHLFDGKQNQINCEEVERAIEIIRWHLSETKRIFCSEPQSTEERDAIKMLAWIKEKMLQTTTPRYLQQYSPIREKQRRNKAIQILEGHHYVQESCIEGKTILLINPKIFSHSI